MNKKIARGWLEPLTFESQKQYLTTELQRLTAKSKTNGTLGHTKLLYCNFEHVSTRILKQMIYHWKALI